MRAEWIEKKMEMEAQECFNYEDILKAWLIANEKTLLEEIKKGSVVQAVAVPLVELLDFMVANILQQPVTDHENPALNRIWRKVVFENTHWIWTGARPTVKSKGVVSWNGKPCRVHRVLWDVFHPGDPLRADEQLVSVCGRPECVRE